MSVIRQMSVNTQISHEERAYWLLQLATSCLRGNNPADLEERYRFVGSLKLGRRIRDANLVEWADQVSSGALFPADSLKSDAVWVSPASDRESLAFANRAIQAALLQLEQSTDRFMKLNLYLIASLLLQQSGNSDGALECRKIVEDALRACEGDSVRGEGQIKAAVSVLNSMAYGIVPVRIPDRKGDDRHWKAKRQGESVPENDFKECERLKLRAVAMVDRLPSDSHLRRKTHRDLALWYMKLGKTEQGEKQKQILFRLVDCYDDRILYPQSAGCGQLTWWKVEPMDVKVGCGMG